MSLILEKSKRTGRWGEPKAPARLSILDWLGELPNTSGTG